MNCKDCPIKEGIIPLTDMFSGEEMCEFIHSTTKLTTEWDDQCLKKVKEDMFHSGIAIK